MLAQSCVRWVSLGATRITGNENFKTIEREKLMCSTCDFIYKRNYMTTMVSYSYMHKFVLNYVDLEWNKE